MKNGHFKLVNTQRGYGISLMKPKDGGAEIRGVDLLAYLDREGIKYDPAALRAALGSPEDVVLELGMGECPIVNERYYLMADREGMQVTIFFQAPSDTGTRVEITEVLSDLRFKKVVYGIQMNNLSEHFQSEGVYDRFLVAAQGKPPRQGKDAEIEYFFNTDPQIQPTVREDGSVDYFHLNMINHCKTGDVLARIIPADLGEPGKDVYGNIVKPRDVKQETLKFGNNIQLSEDRLSISSKVDGHVTLVDDKVFVSNVYEVEDVDLSTGNIEFTGSVQVNGNVKENMKIVAGGNVEVKGVVEGAHIEAGGNIIISRGMNGMTKGSLKAAGNVICKYLENTTVSAEGYVNTESILHSTVNAGTQINVTGRKGFIIGGFAHADDQITVKNLGANMGNTTVVEVGSNPQIKERFLALQQEVGEIVKEIRSAQPVLVNFAEKKAKGAQFTQEQMKAVVQADKLLKEKTPLLNQKREEMNELQEILGTHKDAHIDVLGVACAGTKVVIGDLSMTLKSEYNYCRFERRGGEVKMVPL